MPFPEADRSYSQNKVITDRTPPSRVLLAHGFETPGAVPARYCARHGCQASGSLDNSEDKSVSDTSDDISGASFTRRSNKGGSLMKKAMSFIKEATASDFSAGCANECKFCAGKNLTLGKDRRSVVCADCTKGT